MPLESYPAIPLAEDTTNQFRVVEVLSSGPDPKNIVKQSQDFDVRVEFGITYPFFSPYTPLLIDPNSTWTLKMYAESFADESVPDQKAGEVPAFPLGTGKSWTKDIHVAAMALKPGLYRLTVVLTHEYYGAPTGIAGYATGPMVQILP